MNLSTKKMLITVLIAISLILISGCAEKNATQIPAPQQNTNMPPQTSSIAYTIGELNETPDMYSRAEISGKIIDTMNASIYTYVILGDDAGRIVWAAIPQTTVELGTEGTVEGNIMKDFTSTTLDRTFEAIIFADGIQAAAVENPTNADILESPASYHTVVVSGTVNQTMNTSSYTYLEIDDGTGIIWAAISQTNITTGENVTIDGNAQPGFESKTLNKTFEVLIMGTLVTDSSSNENVSETMSDEDFAAYHKFER
ncbi:MAG TPA: hypothetical protein C5S51_05620 [Methanosarcinaceae archaeon]|nr:hypothetical protein [Methanosarcinaceae archaeon]